jgi:hypothetical protein
MLEPNPVQNRYLEWAKSIESHNVSESTKRVYENHIKNYYVFIDSLDPPEPSSPITIRTMEIFIGHLSLDNKFKYGTLKTVVASFAYNFRITDSPIMTKDVTFKVFASGLLELAPPTNHSQTEVYLLMTLMFFGFLRFSEAHQLLRKQSILEDSVITVTLYVSKTDQFGHGEQVKIFDNLKPYSCFKFIEVLDGIQPNQRIFKKVSSTYMRKIRNHFETLGLPKQTFSGHSFRRGGAYTAAMRGIPDSVIKCHGRWKSECYQKYVKVDFQRAGFDISHCI